jgi:hypothetical protein
MKVPGLTRSSLPHILGSLAFGIAKMALKWRDTFTRGERVMRFIKVKDEERAGDVAINLDLVREAHFGGGLLHLYFEHSTTAQDDMPFTGENAQKIWAAMG